MPGFRETYSCRFWLWLEQFSSWMWTRKVHHPWPHPLEKPITVLHGHYEGQSCSELPCSLILMFQFKCIRNMILLQWIHIFNYKAWHIRWDSPDHPSSKFPDGTLSSPDGFLHQVSLRPSMNHASPARGTYRSNLSELSKNPRVLRSWCCFSL